MALVQYDVYRDVADTAPPQVLGDKRRIWLEAHRAMTETKVPPARAALERAMRDLLQPAWHG